MITDIYFERHTKRGKNFWRIPMINVIFLLLIYVVIGGNMDGFEVLKVDVPVAESSEELNAGRLMIVLGKYDEILVNDELIMPEEVDATLQKAIAAHPGMSISVKADSRMAAPKLIDMLEKIKAAGGTNLTLATQKP